MGAMRMLAFGLMLAGVVLMNRTSFNSVLSHRRSRSDPSKIGPGNDHAPWPCHAHMDAADPTAASAKASGSATKGVASALASAAWARRALRSCEEREALASPHLGAAEGGGAAPATPPTGRDSDHVMGPDCYVQIAPRPNGCELRRSPPSMPCAG
jgi:hypothetical protein